MPPTPLPCSDGLRAFEIHLQTDDYAEETDWSLMDCAGVELAGVDACHYEGSAYYLEQLCVPNDTAYVFIIRDTYGDMLGKHAHMCNYQGNCPKS